MEVQVRTFTIIPNDCIVYHVSVSLLGVTWTVDRRYTEFATMHQDACRAVTDKKVPYLTGPVPSWKRFKTETPLKRMPKLEAYLRESIALGTTWPPALSTAIVGAPLTITRAMKEFLMVSLYFEPRAPSGGPMASRYVIGEQIGRGGYGVVHVGVDSTTAAQIAVKIIPVDSGSSDPQAEYAMLLTLSHPHIVGVIGFDVRDSKAYLYMEWMPGGSVASVLHSFRFRLHETLARKYIRDALLGLVYLHSQAAVHRDIKPANMLVTMDGTLKLSDFGTCKRITPDKTSTQSVTGTPSYMSPEGIRGKLGPSGDVWALGCSLVEMASGVPPWAETGLEDPIAMLFHIGCVPPTGAHHPAIPPHLSSAAKKFCASCFVVDPSRRPTCEALLAHPWLTAAPSGDEEAMDTYLAMRTRAGQGDDGTESSFCMPATTLAAEAFGQSPASLKSKPVRSFEL